ncbi:glycosyltransferase [Flaviaesturariibacter flavus]|uniref:Glycosyltransferase n=1 Tax=Flaviaesturariibacter flavus TaxID=2502780 RepID=A0A4R1BJG4_9BACT|nr:glycosyltransferase [Flaviaesturariibacter flavus]TCJ17456.1 glycosyltransferase [Flaviaesturariibacter flavus]
MNHPTVSVLLPVYNAGRYLREAIDSVLAQTFTDFELLVLNDGSTDDSEAIIESYKDPRLKHLANDKNRGLIYTLNRGIGLAQGRYFARMDADDVCHPERFARQVEFLESNEAAVVATTLEMMDEAGAPLPPWADDRACISPSQIREKLLRDNCIAHPSVMGRAEIFKKYRYQEDQKEAEDYDLWLRLVADGHVIAKLNEPLLRYRVLAGGLTRREGLNAFERLARTKGKFLARRKADGTMNEYCRRLRSAYRRDLFRARIKKWLGR